MRAYHSLRSYRKGVNSYAVYLVHLDMANIHLEFKLRIDLQLVDYESLFRKVEVFAMVSKILFKVDDRLTPKLQ